MPMEHQVQVTEATVVKGISKTLEVDIITASCSHLCSEVPAEAATLPVEEYCGSTATFSDWTGMSNLMGKSEAQWLDPSTEGQVEAVLG